MRTTETSSGAAIVDPNGKLLGIVVFREHTASGSGWSYAVPVRHVRRLLRTLDAQPNGKSSLVVLKRRRPEVGMVLQGNQDGVFVERVAAQSPAASAGIRVGDRVLAADGVKIRSVYQAVRPVLGKQPGDTITFQIARNDEIRDTEVVLGGGIELPSAPFDNLTRLVQPKIDLEQLPGGGYRAKKGGGEIREVFAFPPEPEIDPAGELTDARKIELLQTALDRYRAVIVYLQEQLKKSEHQRLRSESLLRSLESQRTSPPKPAGQSPRKK